MLEKPGLQDEAIIGCIQKEYGLIVKQIAFLPLGADQNSAVYRAATNTEKEYFVKLRRGAFDEAGVTVPKFLSGLGIQQIIPPLATQTGRLWARLPSFHMILYPYVKGCNAFEKKLSVQQWMEFGAALKRFHTADLPSSITLHIKRDTFSPEWRNQVRVFLERINKETFKEPVAAETAAFLKSKSGQTLEMVGRSEKLANRLQKRHPEFILCHADIHGWNLLIDEDGALFMVDWDTLVFAPKERDLMFVGSGLGDSGYSTEEEEAHFYEGYGPVRIDPKAIAYYRYERIIEDIAVYCGQLLLSDEGGEDRKQSLLNVKSNYLPKGTIERAYSSDKASKYY